MTGKAHLGSAWRKGLPPGVYEDRSTAIRQVEVRLDVAAFVGLTERGPLDRAVPIDSFDAYRTFFGAPGGGRRLGESVYLFFANGGRRCVVLRAASRDATPSIWNVPGIRSGITNEPLQFAARNCGAWGDRLRGRFRYTLQPVSIRPAPAEGGDLRVFVETNTVEVGTVLRLVVVDADGKQAEHFGWIKAIDVNRNGRRIAALSSDLAALLLANDPKLKEKLAALQEVRLDIEIATLEVRERFTDLGLEKSHSRFALDVLHGDPERPEANPGSLLIEPVTSALSIRPPLGALLRGEYETQWTWRDLAVRGSDAPDTTYRRDFFQFDEQRSRLDLLDVYDESNEAQPVASVCLPDLVHPSIDETAQPPRDPEPPADALRFGECSRPAPIEGARPVVLYPKLLRSYELLDAKNDERSALGWQAELVARCEMGGRSGEIDGTAAWGRVAILDLPPGLSAGDVLRWRREVNSSRGAAALYGPYLRMAPAEAKLDPPVVVPPCGAVCGIIARRERSIGVHAAPANEVVEGVIGLFSDEHPSDPGFLHEARVNLIRQTERGPSLLGARTTSDDLEWTHLSVRRLLYWLERQLAIDTRWAVFEPNNRILWSRIARSVESRLSRLHTAGALVGATPAEAYFVRCAGASAGAESRLVVEVGVAPAVPAEFIVFELVQFVDGQNALEEQRA